MPGSEIHPIVQALRKARERAGMTRRHVDEMAGQSAGTTGELEKGRSHTKALDSLSLIAAAIGARISVSHRARLAYDPATIDAACAVVCKLCPDYDYPVERAPSGTWSHRITGKLVFCPKRMIPIGLI